VLINEPYFHKSEVNHFVSYSKKTCNLRKNPAMLKIDMHTHILPEKLPDFAQKFGYGDFIQLTHHKKGSARMMQGNRFFREIKSNCWNPEERIQEYATHNTQVQVVCTIPVMFSYFAKPKDGMAVSQFLNDDIAKHTKAYPRNYIGLGTIPMQDPKIAVKELIRMKNELGFKGIQIGSNINGKNLHETAFYPIWEACEDLDLAVLVHPWNMMGFDEMKRYWLPWLVGMPAETSRALCSMLFGGIFDRFPGLRVNFAHAGGSFLPTLGRIEHGFNSRPDLVAIDTRRNPGEYLGHFWVDSITHDPKLLNYVLDLQGSKRVTLGSDYPFPLGDLEIGTYIEEMNLPHQVVEDIFCNATLEWLNMEKDELLDP
jgi:aminocarboxymuconate-semialdehyde decarboxylase